MLYFDFKIKTVFCDNEIDRKRSVLCSERELLILMIFLEDETLFFIHKNAFLFLRELKY